jgi:hypothetical protein
MQFFLHRPESLVLTKPYAMSRHWLALSFLTEKGPSSQLPGCNGVLNRSEFSDLLTDHLMIRWDLSELAPELPPAFSQFAGNSERGMA